MNDEERTDYDEARTDYHSELQVVRTSTVKEVAHQGRLLTLLNRREHGARRNLIISGDRTTGKTTALRELGRLHELRVRQRSGEGQRIPVVYVTAPPKGSPRKLALEFARFLNIPTITPRHNTADITHSVCQVLTEARTDLVLVDEIHLMSHLRDPGRQRKHHPATTARHPRGPRQRERLPDIRMIGVKAPTGRARPLPLTSPPFPNETVRSYAARLALLNGGPPKHVLRRFYSAERPLDRLDLLAVRSGQTPKSLRKALPELTTAAVWHQPGYPLINRTWACDFCAAAHTGRTSRRIEIWGLRDLNQLCVKHRR
ncbi:TniB family NTP-binding protein [Streptomyces sp. NPDC006711]|uniref:TniB family NTP-binding protein n=1 Tax=unclassified Streptomyces TaxID=2593676 RepID=UPI0033DDE60A